MHLEGAEPGQNGTDVRNCRHMLASHWLNHGCRRNLIADFAAVSGSPTCELMTRRCRKFSAATTMGHAGRHADGNWF